MDGAKPYDERREQIVQELTALLHEYKYDHCVQAVTIIAIRILQRETALRAEIAMLTKEITRLSVSEHRRHPHEETP